MKRWWMRWWHRKDRCEACGQWALIGMPHDRPATWTSRPLWIRCAGMVR